jgi:hypothetical protein
MKDKGLTATCVDVCLEVNMEKIKVHVEWRLLGCVALVRTDVLEGT